MKGYGSDDAYERMNNLRTESVKCMVDIQNGAGGNGKLNTAYGVGNTDRLAPPTYAATDWRRLEDCEK